MNKIALIIRREYITRVRNKTFIILTLIAPLLYGLLIALPIIATKFGQDVRFVDVVDETGQFKYKLKNSGELFFRYPDASFSEEKKLMKEKDGPQLILRIPNQLNIFKPDSLLLLSAKNVGLNFNEKIESAVNERINDLKIQKLKLNKTLLDTLVTNVNITVRADTGEGEKESSSAAASAAAFGGGFLIYMFIFLYGGMVLRGVQEEKQNRIVEIIISSVKPFQLMLGKIVGIAMVGLTQFIVWVILTIITTTLIGVLLTPSAEQLQVAHAIAAHSPASGMMDAAAQGTMHKISSAIGTLNLPMLLSMFVFYFLGGYLLYSSLFAACAAAVDSQSDLYQFMFPISLPIIVSISLIPSVISNPDSNLAVWLSIIPFTAPVIMMARLPFGVPAWQLALSAFILIGGFITTTMFAGKIYRIGILMYGKKITWRELSKWLFY